MCGKNRRMVRGWGSTSPVNGAAALLLAAAPPRARERGEAWRREWRARGRRGSDRRLEGAASGAVGTTPLLAAGHRRPHGMRALCAVEHGCGHVGAGRRARPTPAVGPKTRRQPVFKMKKIFFLFSK